MILARPLALLAFLLSLAAPTLAQEPRLVSMGTGAVRGVYLPVGVALCRLVNQDRARHGIRCAARPSGGSVANVAGLRDGAFDLAIVQSDVQGDAVAGRAAFAEAGAFQGLRAVASLYPEPVTILARRDAGIATSRDLAGKRIGAGLAGSGERVVFDAVMEAEGWTRDSFAELADLGPRERIAQLCAGAIDAFVAVIGHPALLVQEAASTCDVMLVPASSPGIDTLTDGQGVYFPAIIPGSLYRGIDDDTQTFGPGATLVARADLPEAVVTTMLRAIFDDFETLTGLDPVLLALDPQTMAVRGITAPLHSGARAYYRERGWLD